MADGTVKAAQTLKSGGSPKTRRNFAPPRIRKRWAVLLWILTPLVILYGLAIQPVHLDPFDNDRTSWEWFTQPQPPKELQDLTHRPLAYPAAGWAPRSLSEGSNARWISPGYLQVTAEAEYPTLAAWSDGAHAILGRNGNLYQPDQQPSVPQSELSIATEVMSFARIFSVFSSSFSPHGHRIVLGTGGERAEIWDIESGELVVKLEGAGASVGPVAFSPDGKTVVTGHSDGTARTWNSINGEMLEVIQIDGGLVNAVTFSPNGQNILTGSANGTLQIWNASDGGMLRTFVKDNDADMVLSVAFSPDGQQVLASYADASMYLWNAENEQKEIWLATNDSLIMSVAFSPRNGEVLLGSLGGTAELWDKKNGTILRTYFVGEGGVRKVAFSPNGNNIVAGTNIGTALLWDWVSGSITQTIKEDGDEVSVEFSPDGNTLFISSLNAPARLWTSGTSHAGKTAISLPDASLCHSGFDAEWDCPSNPSSTHVGLLSALQSHTASAGGPWEPTLRPEASTHQQSTEPLIKTVAQPTQLAMPDLPENARWHTVKFTSEETIFVLGQPGLILRSDNSTSLSPEFELERNVPGETLTSLYVDQSGTGWIAGERQSSSTGQTELFLLQNPGMQSNNWSELRHDPAPWFFIFGPFLIVLTGFVSVSAFQPGQEQRDGIAGAPASDRPIGWADHDVLKIKPIALAVSRFLRNRDTAPPLTLAITGGWGSGKSSLMNLIQQDLRRYGARPVWFNAWHHKDETHLLAALLENIRAQAIPAWYTWPAVIFRTRLLWMRLKKTFISAFMAILLIGTVFVTANTALEGNITSTFSNLAADISTPEQNEEQGDLEDKPKEDPSDQPSRISELLEYSNYVQQGALGLAILVLGWLIRNKLIAMPANPAELLTQLSSKASLTQFQDKLSFRHRFAEAFDETCRALRTDRQAGLVVIIDDLDRCQPAAVLAVLEAVNYLVTAGPCIIILGVDRNQVEHAIGLGFKDIVDGLPESEILTIEDLPEDADETEKLARKRRAYARHYLEKLFNIEVAVPVMDEQAALSMVIAPKKTENKEPDWLPEFKSHANLTLNVLRVLFVACIVGMIGAYFLEHFSTVTRTISATSQPSNEAPSTAPTNTSNTVTNNVEPSIEESPADRIPFVLQEAPLTIQKDLVSRWLWWGVALLAIAASLLFLLIDMARRETETEKDSDEFAEALREVIPAVQSLHSTPRAIKIFENRMRYLAARIDSEANPRRADFIDRFLIWLGRLKPDFLERKEPSLNETELVILGAEEIVGQAKFAQLAPSLSAIVDAHKRDHFEDLTGNQV